MSQDNGNIDSRAAAHVTNDAGKLLNLCSYNGNGTIVIGDGTHYPISHTGNTFILVQNSTIPLSNVLVAPAIKKNILFVSKLFDDTNFFVEFTPSMYVKNPHTKKIFAEGCYYKNIYVFEEVVFSSIISRNFFHNFDTPSLAGFFSLFES